jgi:hypothetical protein
MTIQETYNLLKELRNRNHLPTLINNLGYKKICEVGVWKADYFKILLRSKVDMAVMVDPWTNNGGAANDFGVTNNEFESIYQDAVEITRTDPRASIVRMMSVAAAQIFPDSMFDLVYIDADHSYEAAKADIAAWWPKVRVGGIICGHDYGRKRGVVPAVNGFVRTHNLEDVFYVVPQRCASWFIVKDK